MPPTLRENHLGLIINRRKQEAELRTLAIQLFRAFATSWPNKNIRVTRGRASSLCTLRRSFRPTAGALPFSGGPEALSFQEGRLWS
jgi:hypothetical protein